MLKVVLSCLALLSAVSGESCYSGVNIGCGPTSDALELPTCNALYGAFSGVASEMQAYANLHLERSYEFLLSSTYYNNYQANREGFAKLYKKMSDDAWEKTIGLIKHITKRGGVMDFKTQSRLTTRVHKNTSVELHELGSLAKALDIHKEMADRAFYIHREATRTREAQHDPEVSHYLEEEFMEKQAETIRELAGHTNDLKHFISDNRGQDMSISLYLFDEYLQKVV